MNIQTIEDSKVGHTLDTDKAMFLFLNTYKEKMNMLEIGERRPVKMDYMNAYLDGIVSVIEALGLHREIEEAKEKIIYNGTKWIIKD